MGAESKRTVAAFVAGFAILFVPAYCQGQNGFYFGQPENRFVPAFQNSPQNTGPFFDQNGFNTQYRSTGPEFSRQQVYNNQNDQSYSDARFGRQPASPFRTQTVRNQDSNQYYLNQADFVPNADSLQRPDPFGNRPTSFQFNNHPASTTRPEYSHFVQSSHNHDPSKQETFLGQITINNPFPDNPRDLQNFANTRIRQPNHSGFYKSSSLDNSDLQPGFPNAPEPVSQDIYEYTEKTKPTTYNPAKSDYASKIKQNRAQLNSRPSFYSAQKQEEPEIQKKPFTSDNYFSSNENNFSNSRSRFKPKPLSTTTPHPQTERRNRFSPSTKAPSKVQAFNLRPNKVGFSPNKPHYIPTTEYKPLFDLEPLLEDEIPDTKLYGDTLRSHSNGSEDVQVIKSVEVSSEPPPTTEYDEDVETTIKPVEEEEEEELTTLGDDELITVKSNENKTRENEVKHTTESNVEPDETLHDPNVNDKKPLETTEYYDDEVEYVDENEPEHNKETAHSHHEDSTFHNGEEIEYEEVPDNDEISTPVSETFDVLTMKPKPTMVKDDNFKEFVDSALIDNTEPPTFVTEQFVEPNEKQTTIKSNENLTDPPPILLGEEVVSVVTTKSVVNGTYKVPEMTSRPLSTIQMATELSENNTEEGSSGTDSKQNQTPNATESWVVVASVQTSRSVSGARFLPFPAVAHEDNKQPIAGTDESEEATLVKNKLDTSTTTEEYTETVTNKPSLSTESIIDKLDDLQSRLSSGFLSGGFKAENQDFAVLTEMPHENVTKEEPTTTPTPTPPIQIFTVKSTTSTSTTERTAPEPLPVTIKKFSPYSRPSSTTPKPKPKIPSFETVKMDDLTGLLPPGFKARPSYKDRKITTTTEKQEAVTENKTAFTSAILKSKIIIPDDISAFLPKGYKPPKDEKPLSIDDLLKNTKTDDISHLLPPGFKNADPSTEKPAKNKQSLLANAEPVDISAFLPKGYKLLTTTTEKPSSKSDILAQAKPVDISAFLPPGFKFNETTTAKSKPALNNIKFADVSSLLPPGFKLDKKNKTEEKTTQSVEVTSTTAKAANNNFKVVFPSRPGAGKPGKRLTTPRSSIEGSSIGGVSLPSIHKGWPSRAPTEFTGWPTPSTTPFSIEKLLEAQKAATATPKEEEASIELSTKSTPSTTPAPTSPSTTVSTTPGTCEKDCDLAATIKIVGGVKWVPELLDHNTKEWQLLANEVSRELDSAYSKSPSLKKWYKGIRIDSFSKGSVLVDYFVELNEISDKIDTTELKKLFHKSLNQAKPGSVVEVIEKIDDNQPDKLTGRKIDSFDPDVMVGDEPLEARLERNKSYKEIIDISKGKLEIGKYILDPIYTEFIVLPKRMEATITPMDDNTLLPQWGIAVIVIALASLLFVIIFGVTVLVNRQKSAKAKQPIPLSEDMLRELDKSHMGGVGDDLYMQDHDPPYPPRNPKRGSTAMLDPLPYPGNPGDSWRSEWGPYYNQYHAQHYAPDSGRGSQSYTGGNTNYGYSGSQTYGYNGGGSQNYGYSEGVRTLYPRRRSDFDSNF